jgi:D-amino peptidase
MRAYGRLHSPIAVLVAYFCGCLGVGLLPQRLPAVSGSSAPTVLILADMEGTMGIADTELLYGSPAHAVYGRALLTREVNAAIRGAIGAGARTVVFSDSHFQGNNFLWDQVTTPLVRLPKHALEGSYAAAEVDHIFSAYHPEALVLIAYHVMSGADGYLPHTFTTRDFVRINGREFGEIGLLALIAGEHHVALVAMSGDAGAAAEAVALQPRVAAAATKRLLEDGSVALEPLDRAAASVEAAVRQGFTQRQSIPPVSVTALGNLPEHWEYEFRSGTIPPLQMPDGVSRNGDKLEWTATRYDDGYWKLFEIYKTLTQHP